MTTQCLRQRGARSACARLWVSFLLGLLSCTWTPVAREVQPELVIAGPARVVRLLDNDGKNAFVEIGEGDAKRQHIVHLEGHLDCVLPSGGYVPDWVSPHLAPNLRGPNARAFLLPYFMREGEDRFVLYYTDEHCVLRGPFGPTITSDLGMLQLRSDSRNVSLVRDADNTMRLVDPWGGQSTKIADKVVAYAAVLRSDSSNAPEALWLLEDEKLTMRALDGTLLLPLGSRVTEFRQTLRDALRIAYVDDGDLYEAKGPGFQPPVLIARGACHPLYRDNSLDLHMPCEDEQLVRIDLTSGVIRNFAAGVFASYNAAELTFEQSHDVPEDFNKWELYVSSGTAGSAPRAKLVPRPDYSVSVISRQRLVGRTLDGQLGIWSLDGQFTPGYQGITRIQTFRDSRTGQLLWLITYDEDENRIGTVGVVDQRQLEALVTSVKSGVAAPGTSDAAVPGSKPLVIAERAHRDGYRVFYPGAVHEPVILALQPPVTVIDPERNVFSGALHAYLLSAEESMRFDDDVQSYEIVASPLPGILYGILQGPDAGLWFSAL